MAQRTRLFLLYYGPLLTTITIFVLAYFVGAQMYPAMQKPQAFFNLFINNGALLIVGIGMTFVILTGGIGLTEGEVLALTTAASAALLKNGASPAVVMPLMLIMGTALGFTLGCIVHFFKVQAFIVTLMGLFFARGLAYIISLTSVTINNSFYKYLALTQISIRFIAKAYVYIPSLVGPLLLLVAIYITFFTRFGRSIYAIGN